MRSCLLLASLLGLLLVAVPAFADEAAEKEARALFAKAKDRMEAGDHAGALEQYRAAYAKWPNAKILLNIGTMLRELGRSAEAADAYDAYLRDPGTDPAKKGDVAKLLGELEARTSKLHITVDNGGATVRVDGKVVSHVAAANLRVEPGTHTIVAEKAGTPPVVANVTTMAGKEESVTLHVAAAAAPPAVADAASVKLAPSIVQDKKTAPAKVTLDVAKDSAPGMPPRRMAGIVVGAVGLAGIGIGAAFGALAMSKNNASKANGHCDASSSCDATGKALRLDAFQWAAGSTAGFVVGGVALAGGVILVATASAKPHDASTSVVVKLGPRSMSLVGRW